MLFVIDETSWFFDSFSSDTFVQALEQMLDLLEDARAGSHTSCYSEDLFNVLVFHEKTYYDLYSPDSPIQIPNDVKERFASIFNSLAKWQELPLECPTSFEVKIDKTDATYAPSIAWAHRQAVKNDYPAVACLVFPGSALKNAHEVTAEKNTVTLWFIMDWRSHCEFFRWLIIKITKGPNELEMLAPSAFPEIDFVDGIFSGIKNMSKNYTELVVALVEHLSAFSDHGSRIFLGPWDKVPAEFGSLGINISDENGNTKSSGPARRDRTVKVDGVDIVFWWHSKLERDRDRIHIYPDRIANGGKLLVGIFCRHLI